MSGTAGLRSAVSDPPVTSVWFLVSLPSPRRARRSGDTCPLKRPTVHPPRGRPGAAGAPVAPVAPVALVAMLALLALVTLSACGLDGAGATGGSPQPGGAGSTAEASGSGSRAPALVPGTLLHGPLGCPTGIGVLVLRRLAVQLVRPYTAVVARCDSGAGSPPSGVYLIAGDAETAAVAETLVRPAQELQVSALTATAGGITLSAAGYSRADVPRCCQIGRAHV